MAMIFDRICVQYGTFKQKLRPWRYIEDFGLIEGGPDEPIYLNDFGNDPDKDGLVIGITVEHLRVEVTFVILSSAVAFRDGTPLAENDLVEPGDFIEFLERQPSPSLKEYDFSGNASPISHKPSKPTWDDELRSLWVGDTLRCLAFSGQSNSLFSRGEGGLFYDQEAWPAQSA